jgi:hypothetical protein
MSARRDVDTARRQCARFGCSALADATFTFDSGARMVWLDTPAPGAARAGELCDRHAGSLIPPRGWRLEDRRVGEAAPAGRHRAGRPDPQGELRRLLDARSPLLARAFRNSGTV